MSACGRRRRGRAGRASAAAAAAAAGRAMAMEVLVVVAVAMVTAVRRADVAWALTKSQVFNEAIRSTERLDLHDTALLDGFLRWNDTEICKEAPKHCRCEVFNDPKILVNNRIPKCGSTSLYQFAMMSTEREGCDSCFTCLDGRHSLRRFPLVRESPTVRPSIEEFVKNPFDLCAFHWNGTHSVTDTRGVVVSHQFFIPHQTEEQRNIIHYFGLLRDAPSRCHSRFYFEHQKHRIPMTTRMPDFDAYVDHDVIGISQSFSKEQAERVRLVREECTNDYATHWFCGMQEQCYDPKVSTEWKLQEAKRVLAEEYAVVGLYPNIWQTAWLLNVIFPGTLGPLRNPLFHKKVTACEHCAKDPAWQVPPVSAAQRSSINRKNPYDAQLWHYVERLYKAKMAACVGYTKETHGRHRRALNQRERRARPQYHHPRPSLRGVL